MHDLSVDVGESEVSPLKGVGEPFVVTAQECENRGL